MRVRVRARVRARVRGAPPTASVLAASSTRQRRCKCGPLMLMHRHGLTAASASLAAAVALVAAAAAAVLVATGAATGVVELVSARLALAALGCVAGCSRASHVSRLSEGLLLTSSRCSRSLPPHSARGGCEVEGEREGRRVRGRNRGEG